MFRFVVVALLIGEASACGGSAAKSPTSTARPLAAQPTAKPHQVPEYPGAELGGVTGGVAHMVMVSIASDSVQQVRAFYSKQRLTGFEVLEGDLSKESPLHVRDAVGGQEFLITVYDEKGATMIEVAVKQRN